MEEALDEVEGTVGSDVRTKVKISQSKKALDKSDGNGKLLDTVARPIRNCLPNRNCAVRVIVTAPKFIRRDIIERAAQKLRNTASFGKIFRTAEKGYKIRKKKDNKFIVVVKFKDSFLQLFR